MWLGANFRAAVLKSASAAHGARKTKADGIRSWAGDLTDSKAVTRLQYSMYSIALLQANLSSSHLLTELPTS